jgi:hypothetical protein
MKNRVSGEERSVFFTASTSIERAARRLNVLLALILGVSWCSVVFADVLDVDLSSATVGGQVPITSQFLPNVVWIDFYVDSQYVTSTGGSTGSFSWNSTSVSDGYHDITTIGLEASGSVSDYSNIHLRIAHSGPSASPGTVPISGYADQYIGWINLRDGNSVLVFGPSHFGGRLHGGRLRHAFEPSVGIVVVQ